MVEPPPPPPPPLDASDTRIIAPHVELLSLGSVVEVVLVSCDESVAVLCAVDVLKMQSCFFQGLLQAQEAAASEQQTRTPLDEVSATVVPSHRFNFLFLEVTFSILLLCSFLRCGATPSLCMTSLPSKQPHFWSIYTLVSHLPRLTGTLFGQD